VVVVVWWCWWWCWWWWWWWWWWCVLAAERQHSTRAGAGYRLPGCPVYRPRRAPACRAAAQCGHTETQRTHTVHSAHRTQRAHTAHSAHSARTQDIARAHSAHSAQRSARTVEQVGVLRRGHAVELEDVEQVVVLPVHVAAYLQRQVAGKAGGASGAWGLGRPRRAAARGAAAQCGPQWLARGRRQRSQRMRAAMQHRVQHRVRLRAHCDVVALRHVHVHQRRQLLEQRLGLRAPGRGRGEGGGVSRRGKAQRRRPGCCR
jgi:hypothetical protein